MNIDSRIQALREQMKQEKVDAYIIPSGDPHQSEYPPARWKSREWISGFTGSAGTVVVTKDHAGLWTDSRYFIQAEDELAKSEMQLHKMYNQFSPGYIKWLKDHLDSGATVAIDGELFTPQQRDRFEKVLSKKEIRVIITEDLIGAVWQDRPGMPADDIFEHDIRFAGKSRNEKLAEIREAMKDQGASHFLLTALDDIAWALNLRGYDVEYNPVFVAYAVITPESVVLFTDSGKIPESLSRRLQADNILIQDYDTIRDYLYRLDAKNAILIDESGISIALRRSIQRARVISGPPLVRNIKAIKNETELAHFRRAMIKDGVALTHAFVWLEEKLEQTTVSEYAFASKLAECRARQEHYYGESFSAIVGYKGNGAIIHYRPDENNSAQIMNEGILLCDSGGQYYDGTTDITRTICFSTPTDEQKNAYTRVLRGHIALAMAQFPEGTNGAQLDTYARQYLWEDGMNFLHGTGHGVGFFMNVHEPPQGFAPGSSLRSTTAHKKGMVSSNEPGFYKENEFGIRIENLVVAKYADTDGFLEFETITLFPIDTRLIDRGQMEEKEISWLNNYHRKVYDKLSPELDDKHKSWLKRKCEAL